MGRRLGRARPPAAVSLLLLAGSFFCAAVAQADEVILDPELTGAPSDSGSADGELVIMDPELAGSSSSTGGGDEEIIFQGDSGPTDDAASSDYEDDYDPMANTGIAHVYVATQGSVDINHEGAMEDYYEARFRFAAEVDFRMSRHLRLALGTRLNFAWAAPYQNDPTLARENTSIFKEDRYALDLIPSAAYIDVDITDGMHLRLGTQLVSLGRMDFYAPSNILAAFDLRPQPAGPGGASKLSQPAVRLDWDLARFATLQMVYLPWFSPNVSVPDRDRYVASAFSGQSAVKLPTSLGSDLAPSWQTRNSDNALRYLGPEPDFTHPQAQARLTLRATSFEIALTSGTALEKLPSVYLAPLVEYYLRHPPDDPENPNDLFYLDLARHLAAWNAAYPNAKVGGFHSVDVAYPRYYQVGFDGSFDIAPLTFAFEFSYSPRRYWLMAAAKKDAYPKNDAPLPQPNLKKPLGWGVVDPDGRPIDGRPTVKDKNNRAGVPMVELALHLEWLRGADLALVGEVFWMNALELPYDLTRDWAGFIPDTGAFVGGVLAGSYTGGDNRWTLAMAAILAVGPSLILGPQLEVRVSDNAYVSLGASIVEGPDPNIDVLAGSAATNFTIGGLFSGYDQVMFGLRWGI